MNAQQCGTEPPLNYQTYENSSTSSPNVVAPNYCVNVAFRIVRNNDGTNGYDVNNIPLIVNQLNQYFNPLGITIVPVGTYTFVNNTILNNYTGSTTITPIPNAINLYLISYSPYFAGLANPNQNYAYIVKSGLNTIKATICHELGHCLNLLHTFQCTSSPYNASCAENPNGTNPYTTGDQIFDTPADYNPWVQPQNPPLNLGLYNPDKTNFMSYWNIEVARNHFTPLQGVRMKNAILNAPYLQNVRSNQCAAIDGAEYICSTGDNTFNIVGYGTPLNYSWSVSNNLVIIGSSTSSSVVIKSSNPNNTGNATITVIINGVTKTITIAIGGPIIYPNNQVYGLYDWVSVGYGNMGLIAQTNSSIASFKWIIEEDTDFINPCPQTSKPRFINSTSSPYNYESNTNQAIVNWGTCSGSYLITCIAVNECGESFYKQHYVDVGLPKNNPCFRNTVQTVIAPNPIQNKEIQVVVNKTPQQLPCNWKTRYTFQDFNNKIDQTKNNVSIYDFNGNLVHTQIYETDEFTIKDLNLIEGNNYIVNLTTNEGIFSQQIIIVE